MIDQNELGLQLRLAIHFNRLLYPVNRFVKRNQPKTSKTEFSLIVKAVDDKKFMAEKVQIATKIVTKALNILGTKESSPVIAQGTIYQIIAESMPTAHKALAAKNYVKLRETLDLIRTISSDALNIDDPNSNFDLHDAFGQSLLHLAAYNNDPAAVELLIKTGVVSPEDCLKNDDLRGLTPLQIILYHTQDPILETRERALIILKQLFDQHWLDLNEAYVGDLNLMHYAALTNNAPLCKLLVLLGAKINVVNPEGDTPLHVACKKNALEITNALLAADKVENNDYQSLRKINQAQKTPLRCAEDYGSKDVVRLINARLAKLKRDKAENEQGTGTKPPLPSRAMHYSYPLHQVRARRHSEVAHGELPHEDALSGLHRAFSDSNLLKVIKANGLDI